MASATSKLQNSASYGTGFKVADMGLADWGRKEIVDRRA